MRSWASAITWSRRRAQVRMIQTGDVHLRETELPGDAILRHLAEEPHVEDLPLAFGQRPQQRAERLTVDDHVEAGLRATESVGQWVAVLGTAGYGVQGHRGEALQRPLAQPYLLLPRAAYGQGTARPVFEIHEAGYTTDASDGRPGRRHRRVELTAPGAVRWARAPSSPVRRMEAPQCSMQLPLYRFRERPVLRRGDQSRGHVTELDVAVLRHVHQEVPGPVVGIRRQGHHHAACLVDQHTARQRPPQLLASGAQFDDLGQQSREPRRRHSRP